jgi:hypothetical protein
MDPSDPAYVQQCGFALEPSIIGLIEQAVEAGWSRGDVVLAILGETGRYLGNLELDPDRIELYLDPHANASQRAH